MVLTNLMDLFGVSESSKNDLVDLIYKNSPNAVVITDPKANILSVNQAFVELTGLDEDFLVGNNMRCFNSGLTSPEVYSNLWNTIKKGETWEGVLTNITGNRGLSLHKTTILPLAGEDKKILGYVGFKSDITGYENLKTKANIDDLTNLPNRNALESKLNVLMDESNRNNKFMSLMFMDLDGFKFVNDTYGHAAGDYVLKEASKRFLTCLRPDDFVSRLGGDEFVCLLPNFRTKEKLFDVSSNIAKRINDTISTPFIYNNGIENFNIEIGVSIGVVEFPKDEVISSSQYLSKADELMYEVKKSGKGSFLLSK